MILSMQPQPNNTSDQAQAVRGAVRPGAGGMAAAVPLTGTTFLASLAKAIGPPVADGAADVASVTIDPTALAPGISSPLAGGAAALPVEPGPVLSTGIPKSGGSRRFAAALDDLPLTVPDDTSVGIQPVIVPVAIQMPPNDPQPKTAQAPAAIGAVPPRKSPPLTATAPPAEPPSPGAGATPPTIERIASEWDPAVAPNPAAAIPPGPILAGPMLAGLTANTRVINDAPVKESPGKAASILSQIAPALVSLAGGPPGTQRLTLRLDPIELGHVQIRIDRTKDGPAEVRITVERPETLALLQRDQHQLHLALDQAGIPAEGRQVTFYTGPSAEPPLSGQLSGASQDAGSGRGQPGGRGQSGQGEGAARQDDAKPITTGWLRAGLDITA